eukprot:3062451-Rhodomonas_salina.1
MIQPAPLSSGGSRGPAPRGERNPLREVMLWPGPEWQTDRGQCVSTERHSVGWHGLDICRVTEKKTIRADS